MRVALYARVSTRRQAQAQTVEQQLERLTDHVRQQGWDVPLDHIFRDDGYSGASLRRPGLDRLRDRAAARTLDLVVIAAPDRVARNYVHQVLLLEELEGHGCAVRFLDRPMSHDPHDQLLLQIRGAVAEYERTLISERMRRGRQRKLEAGLMRPWTRPPFGYRVDPNRPRDPAGVRVEEPEAAIVREMFAWYAEEAHRFCSLARRLQQHGIRTSTGLARWNLASIRALLTNPAYAGLVYGNRWHRRGPPQGLQVRQQGLRRGQASLGQQLERLTDAYLAGVVALDEYRRRRGDLERRQQQLEEQARQLEAQADRQKELAGLSSSIGEFCRRVRQGLDKASFEQRRSLIELLVDRVIVTDGEVEIRYVMPTDRASEQVRFCHLRLAYLDPVVEPAAAPVPGEAPQLAVPLHLAQRAGVAREPVGHDGPRVAGIVPAKGAPEEALGRLLVPLGAEQEVDRLAGAVDGTVELAPLTTDLHIGLVDVPRPTARP
jgi:DNA invertase Pin-like site-specific DNA recombinase